eukprot:5449065-Prymnesium_polylepis.1
MGPDQDPRDAKRVTGAENQLSNLARWTRATPSCRDHLDFGRDCTEMMLALIGIRGHIRNPSSFGILWIGSQ